SPKQSAHRQIVQCPGGWHAFFCIENPPRHASRIEGKLPALAALEVKEMKFWRCRSDKFMFGADAAQVAERRCVAGQDEVIAVVYHHADEVIIIGAAAASGRARRFVDDNVFPTFREFDGCGEPGKAGADNVDGA